MLEKIRKFGYGMLRRASDIIVMATLPLFTSESGRARVGFLGTIKNRFLKVIGKGAPLQEDSDKIRSSQSERRRGNVFNPSFAHDGRLTLRLMDGLIDEDALKVLDVVNTAGALNTSDPTKALESLDPSSRSAMSRKSKSEYTALFALHNFLERKGGSLSIERSHDGFSRVLVIKIGVADKTEQDIRYELEQVFKALKVSDPELIKGISEQLRKRGGASELDSMSVVDSQKSQGLSSNVGEDRVTHGDARDEKSNPVDARNTRANTPVGGAEVESSSVDNSMDHSASGDRDLSDESFSMSGAAIPPSFSAAGSSTDPASMQFQFLREGSASPLSDAKLTKEGSRLTMTDVSLEDAAAGLEMVESCGADTSLPPQPTASPTTQSQRPGASR